MGGRARLAPVVNGRVVLFVPKFIVRYRLCLDSAEYYNHHILNFLREEHLAAGSGLVRVLRSGERRVFKKTLKEIYPFSKEFLADFTRRNPRVLELYKQLAADTGSLRNADFDQEFDEALFARALNRRFTEIRPGMNSASEYHAFMLGALTFLFYPDLVAPVKENEIHQGRKRIDIFYTNSSRHGFFYEMLVANQTRAIRVPIECKNYSADLGNPEIDQIAGRFGPTRGKFGIICCRRIFDPETLASRCRDSALDDRGFIVVLDDTHISKMLENVSNGRREMNSGVLRELFNVLTN